VGFIEHEQFRFGGDGADQCELGALALAEPGGGRSGIESELGKERVLQFAVPVLAEAGLVIERLADIHPRVERDEVRDVGQAGLHRGFVASRIEPEDAHGSLGWSEEVEQALDGGRLAGAVAAEEPVALAGFHSEGESVQGFRATVSLDQALDLDGGSVHGFAWKGTESGAGGAVGFLAFAESFEAFVEQGAEVVVADLQVVGCDDHGVQFSGEAVGSDGLAELGGAAGLEEATGTLAGLDDAFGFEFGVGAGGGVAVDAEFLGEGADGGEGLTWAERAAGGGVLHLLDDLEVDRDAGLEVDVGEHGDVETLS
jgi:hypothetical protein